MKITSDASNNINSNDKNKSFLDCKDVLNKIDFSDFNRAIKEVDLLIAEWPKNSYLYAQRGVLNFHEKNYFSAIDDFTKALIFGGNSIKKNVLEHRAIAKEMYGDVLGAFGDYILLLKNEPSEKYLINLAIISGYLGRHDWEEMYYKDVLKINPENEIAIRGLESCISRDA